MLVSILVQLALVVGLMLLVATVAFVRRHQIDRTREELPVRLRVSAPIAFVLVIVLLLNSVIRQYIPDISWIFANNTVIGWELTWTFYRIEGDLIAWIQTFQHPALTAFFSFIYVYGYAFLLVFPVVAYLVLSETRPLRLLLAAYTLNYTIGPLLYVFFIVYGPRNFAAEGLLYDVYPRYQHLTGEINRNTNVFPSLHTSLAVTVAVLAYWTRDRYRGWYYLSVFLAVCVAISTMYLGIHWAIDVIGGLGLAWLSVYLANVLVDRWSVSAAFRSLYRRYVEPTTH